MYVLSHKYMFVMKMHTFSKFRLRLICYGSKSLLYKLISILKKTRHADIVNNFNLQIRNSYLNATFLTCIDYVSDQQLQIE